ncbi:hypothetical protein PC115_g25917 [Phytophthora cactorum]|uniref:Major facilitator superfamily (MFS) profile domain-containing protein n=1 Tax=Phytophthora cactorum TaxID=29920 RepID=A0A8T0YYM7_9STRA|nr:hypothetical protein PC115_g25917 [Phytophthora cactorum]
MVLLGAIAGNYEVMMASRIIAGVASSAAFGVSISISASLVEENQRGRAVSIIFGGLMIATVLGTPAATSNRIAVDPRIIQTGANQSAP